MTTLFFSAERWQFVQLAPPSLPPSLPLSLSSGLPMEKYIKLEQIGRGSFGTVHKIKRVSDGQIMVWKELDYGKMSDKEKQLVVGEVNILRELRHPYILRYHDRIIDKKSTKLYIIVEYCERGDLRHLIKRAKSSRTFVHEERIWKYFAQILSALKTCHRRREKGALNHFLHRDIKPANVFLDRNDNAKLGDFGLARSLESMSKFAYTNVGTPFYMAPEQTNRRSMTLTLGLWDACCTSSPLSALVPRVNQLALAMKINAGRSGASRNTTRRISTAQSAGCFILSRRGGPPGGLESLPEIRQQAKWAAGAGTANKGTSKTRPPRARPIGPWTAGSTAKHPQCSRKRGQAAEERLRLVDAEARLAEGGRRDERDASQVAGRSKQTVGRRDGKAGEPVHGGGIRRRDRRTSSSTTAKTAAFSVASSSAASKKTVPVAQRERMLQMLRPKWKPCRPLRVHVILISADAKKKAMPLRVRPKAAPLPQPPPLRAGRRYKGDEALQVWRQQRKGWREFQRCRKALKDMGNDKEYTRRPSVGDWSAQAQVSKFCAKQKADEQVAFAAA